VAGVHRRNLHEVVWLRGRAPRGERLVGYAPHGHWKTITFVGGLRQRGMTAPFVLEGAINGPMFLAHVKQCLVPTLKRGEIVLMDHLPVHKVAGVGGGDRSSGRDVDLSSEVFAGPQPDRAGLQQTQGASAQGGRTYDSAVLVSDRSRCYRFQPARMQELLSPRRLYSNMTGIRSSSKLGHRTGRPVALRRRSLTVKKPSGSVCRFTLQSGKARHLRHPNRRAGLIQIAPQGRRPSSVK
jgi:hypothetical protein